MRRPGADVLGPVVLLVGAMASIQLGAVFAKSLFPLIGAQGTTALRVGFAALLLVAFWRPWRAHLTRRRLRFVVLYGAALGAMNLLFYMALARIPLGLAVALEFLGPLGVAFAASRRRLDFLWACLAAAGVILILPVWPGGAGVDPTGVALALGAGACWALYIVFGRRAGEGDPGRATALGMTVAAILVLPVGAIHAGGVLISPTLAAAGLAVAFLSSALPYSLEMIALTRLPSRTYGVLTSLEPALGALAGLVFLGERLSMLQVAALASIVAASVGSAATARPPVPVRTEV